MLRDELDRFSENMSQRQRWFCAQLGGREHYAVPRALHAAGVLDRLFTDYWSGAGMRLVSKSLPSKAIRSLSARYHEDVPATLVTSWNARSLLWESRLRLMGRAGGVAGRYLGYCDVGSRFARAVSDQIRKSHQLTEDCVFFGFDTCSLEAMEMLKSLGVACVLDQIDPCRVEIEMVQMEQQNWPEWQNVLLDVPDEFFERHVREWDVADKIVVNSVFSRDALVQQGVQDEKIVVIPLSYETSVGSRSRSAANVENLGTKVPTHFTRQTPLRVLFLGQVMLRKGIQYLVQAAKSLLDYPIVFDIVGPLHIAQTAIDSAPRNMTFHGRTPRSEITRWYRDSHVFALPTLSDGFAITQLEAMANGLPVIATPNCGEVVTDEVDGVLVPPRAPESIAHALLRYMDDPEYLKSHQLAALRKSRQFSLQQIGKAWLNVGEEAQRANQKQANV